MKSITKTSKKNNKEVRIAVREIQNGFIISKSTEWTDPKKGWQQEHVEWYSKDDPFINSENKSLADSFD